VDKLNEIIEDIFNINKSDIINELDIRQTKKWDSLNHIHFVFAIEEAYKIELSQDEIVRLAKVSDIKEIIMLKNQME
tara:strand:- start:1082 stop:1312 length:231 start_codon:yes stop_codon:yes gene_type:complete